MFQENKLLVMLCIVFVIISVIIIANDAVEVNGCHGQPGECSGLDGQVFEDFYSDSIFHKNHDIIVEAEDADATVVDEDNINVGLYF